MRIHLDQRYVIAASCVLALVLSIVLAVTAYEIVGDPLAELSQSEDGIVDDDVVEGAIDTEVLGLTETAEDQAGETSASRDLARPDDDVIRETTVATTVNDESADESAGAAPLALIAETAEISGRVWIDVNGNGVQDRFDSDGDGLAEREEPGDPSGVTVRLLDPDRNFEQVTTTNGSGEYSFIVEPATYVLFFEVEPASISPRFAGDNRSLDSDIAPATFFEPGDRTGIPGGLSDTVAVAAGETNNTKDAGIVFLQPSIGFSTATNGVAVDPPGEELAVDETATFTYTITNTGTAPLADIAVVDDVVGVVKCFADSIEPSLGAGRSVTCTATANVSAGEYTSTATVTAKAVDALGDTIAPLSSTDTLQYVGVAPFDATASISLVAATNGEDNSSPGEELAVGDDVTFTYAVTNTGKTELVDIAISDDQLGDICSFSLLTVGETKSCPPVVSAVTNGTYRSVGNVSATPIDPDGQPIGSVVTSSDPVFYVGVATPAECTVTIDGPRMLAGGTVVDETGYVAEAGSTIHIITSEPGASPAQPNEQVYVRVGNDLYGPTPIDLGSFEFTVANTGPVVIVHYSEITGDTSRANSVEYTWCGTSVTPQTFHQCPAVLEGPRMQRNNGGIVEWDSGLIAAPGSTIEITTSEPGTSPGQPNEQLYVVVGDELFGPTPNEHTTTTITVTDGGPVSVAHYSVYNETSFDSNSVEFTLCGSNLTTVG